MNYKPLYSQFLEANEGKLHLTAHSHHYWPDVTKAAQNEYWDDTRDLVDHKWGRIFGKKVTELQALIAEVLNLDEPTQISFAPNTHEFLVRLLSLKAGETSRENPLKVLTTDSEFYSFARQMQRMEEDGLVQIKKISTQPFESFESRMKQSLKDETYDFFYCSQVFFNSGYALKDLTGLVEAASQQAITVIDGYHGYMAVPTDLRAIQDKAFYVAGGYKYAQGGEGCCFLTVPRGKEYRPVNTGWYAELDRLGSERPDRVYYSKTGFCFLGATFDFTPIYRQHAVLTEYKKHGVQVDAIHKHVQHQQRLFLDLLDQFGHPVFCRKNLVGYTPEHHGHFLTFQLPSAQDLPKWLKHFEEHKVFTDGREDRLRFGFAVYHDLSESAVTQRLKEAFK